MGAAAAPSLSAVFMICRFLYTGFTVAWTAIGAVLVATASASPSMVILPLRLGVSGRLRRYYSARAFLGGGSGLGASFGGGVPQERLCSKAMKAMTIPIIPVKMVMMLPPIRVRVP